MHTALRATVPAVNVLLSQKPPRVHLLAQVHHLCTLLAYGADAVCPYLGIAALFAMQQDGRIPAGMSRTDIEQKYIKALNMGVLKVRFPPGRCLLRLHAVVALANQSSSGIQDRMQPF